MSEQQRDPTGRGQLKFSDFKALLFDVYGTLVDWETGIHNELRPIFPDLSKDEVLARFDVSERELQKQYPTMRYSDILARTHGELEKAQGLDASAHADAHVGFGQSIARWAPFPDSIAALEYLATRFKLVVLSNVDKTSFAATQQALEGPPGAKRFEFTAIYTAEDAGAYKPAPGAIGYALRRLQAEHGITKDEVLVVANSVFHDILPARRIGIEGVWIDREGATAGQIAGEGEKSRWFYKDMGGLAEAVKAEN